MNALASTTRKRKSTPRSTPGTAVTRGSDGLHTLKHKVRSVVLSNRSPSHCTIKPPLLNRAIYGKVREKQQQQNPLPKAPDSLEGVAMKY